ncbi:hypothetical protein BBK36DRAFT_1141619 [Trichoderma citrinoviride]|uniref:Pal1-domain-containing protein n=1 Tax=Trichoderma citrinoviride TaxID=58853 RepID=A0A2T4B8X5_9HYPO|nr:hypothetical protein BBK36DRAFT_1141619 [Trichoderma citrinoviride]PTB65669.1 hypothetical protein BBK36DRAFT_1141619 [Trichoderma citrinoviride]
MEHNRSNSRQLAVPQASTSATQLRHRPSFRDRFWTRTSANYDGEDDVISKSQPSPVKKSAYVPTNAASGFARTASSPREQSRRKQSRQEEPSSSSKDTGINVSVRSPLGDLAAGHLYVPTESDLEPASPTGRDTTTDYATFIAAAQNEERVRHAASQRQGGAAVAAVRNSSQYRDSGYYSSSNGGGGGGGRPYSPSLPSSAGAKGQQLSGRSFGQRIAEYIKPPRDEAVAAVRR